MSIAFGFKICSFWIMAGFTSWSLLPGRSQLQPTLDLRPQQVDCLPPSPLPPATSLSASLMHTGEVYRNNEMPTHRILHFWHKTTYGIKNPFPQLLTSKVLKK